MEQRIICGRNTKEGLISVGIKGTDLIVKKLISPAPVGSVPDESNVETNNNLVFDFSCIESVDVFIEKLNDIKENIQYPYGRYPLAC